MATTAALNLTQIEQAQAQKEVTANAAFTGLDAFAGVLDLATTGGTVTLTEAQARSGVLLLTGTLASAAIFVLPTTLRHRMLIVNNTVADYSLTVKLSGGAVLVRVPRGCATPVMKNAAGTELEIGWQGARLPWMRAYRGADYTTLASGSYADVPFDTVAANEDMSYSYNVSTFVWTAKAKGIYDVNAQVTLTNLALTPNPQIKAVMTGAVERYGNGITGVAGITSYGLQLHFKDKFAEGDTLKVQVSHNSGANATIKAARDKTFLQVFGAREDYL